MLRNKILAALAAFGFAAALPSAVYAGELVSNGGFESSGGGGQVGFSTTLTDWSTPAPPSSYVFLFPTLIDSENGVGGQYGNVALWGPLNGPSNGLTDSPSGGAFIGMDSEFQVGALSQTISGLTAGQTYILNFDWAAAQQQGFNGETQSRWQVNFGSQTQFTSFASIPSQGFSGWKHDSMAFTADGSTDLLSFIANGSPAVPPFALLDSVSMQAVPEKSSGIAMMLGVVGFGVFARRRARVKSRG